MCVEKEDFHPGRGRDDLGDIRLDGLDHVHLCREVEAIASAVVVVVADEHLATPCVPPMTSFYGDELKRALHEQAFGVAEARVQTITDLEATAEVVLLEEKSVVIALNMTGYTIGTQWIAAICLVLIRETDGHTCETLEDALERVSPQYAAKRQAIVIQKLFELTNHE